jgi:hypothetical protein
MVPMMGELTQDWGGTLLHNAGVGGMARMKGNPSDIRGTLPRNSGVGEIVPTMGNPSDMWGALVQKRGKEGQQDDAKEPKEPMGEPTTMGQPWI